MTYLKVRIQMAFCHYEVISNCFIKDLSYFLREEIVWFGIGLRRGRWWYVVLGFQQAGVVDPLDGAEISSLCRGGWSQM